MINSLNGGLKIRIKVMLDTLSVADEVFAIIVDFIEFDLGIREVNIVEIFETSTADRYLYLFPLHLILVHYEKIF
jgi:hypothetical protein